MKYGNQVISSIRLGSRAIITKIAKGLVVVYEAWKTLIKRGKTPLTITNCQPDTTAIDYTIYGSNDFQLTLPDEYQQVEYIQTTGTQYIDSKIPLKCGLKTIVEWTYADADSGNSYTGGHIGSPGNRWLIGSQRQKAYYFGIGSSNTSTGVKFGDRDVIEAYWQNTGSYIKINGADPWNITQIATTPLLEEPDYTFYLGATNRDGRGILNPKLTIYNWKFYQDDILIRDFIPCYRKSDRVAGLYDVVTNEFYTNDGTGEFIVGEPTFPSPAPDAPIEMRGVGDKTKNLLNPNNLEQGGAIDATGVDASSIYRVKTKELVKLEAGTYTLSSDTINFRTIHFYNYDTEEYEGSSWASNKNKHTFTLEEKKKVKILFQYSQGNTDPMTVEDVQNGNVLLAKETEVTEYEPYGYKIPITVTPNIYNYEEFFSVPGTAQSVVVSKINFNSINIYQRYQNIFVIPNTLFKPNTTYEISKTLKVISGTSQYNTSRIAIAPSQTSGAFYLIEGNQSTATFTTPADLTDYTYLWIYGIADGEIEIHDISIREVGLEPITTNIYLNEPLAKTGTCANKLTYSAQSIIKSLGHYQFDGSENWEEHTVGQECKVYRLDGVLTPKVGAFVSDTYMTHFALTYIYTTAELTPGLYRFASSNPVSVISSSGRLYVSSTCQTVEEFKEWLSVNKPSIYYPLAENETINIELPALYLPDETNIITVDTEVSPSEIEITYTGRE